MSLSKRQIEQLLKPVNARRVLKDRDGMSHLAAYDVSAHLTRIFGFGGWQKKILNLQQVSEESAHDPKRDNRIGWYVTYRCDMRLIVRDPHGNVVWENEDGATGSASNLPSRGDAHDFALKNAISYALKRCAKDLGDQFGLSLYNKGQTAALVGRVLTVGDEETDAQDHTPDELIFDDDSKDLPRNKDGSISRSRVSQEDLERTGNMTREQLKEHNRLAKETMASPKKADRLDSVSDDDPWYAGAGWPPQSGDET